MDLNGVAQAIQKILFAKTTDSRYMKTGVIKLLAQLMPLLFAGLAIVSCRQGNAVADQRLDRIEQVVLQHPDSALAELVRFDCLHPGRVKR